VSYSVAVSISLHNADTNATIDTITTGANPTPYTWVELSNTVTIPAGCTSVYAKLNCIDSTGGVNNYVICYFDDIRMVGILETIGIFTSPDPDSMVLELSQEHPSHGSHSIHVYNDGSSYFYVESELIPVENSTEYTFSAGVYSSGPLQGEWYLPSFDELQLMYDTLDGIAGFDTTYYWSSSEATVGTVYGIDFTDGSEFTQSKSTTGYYVRPIRTLVSNTEYNVGDPGPIGWILSKEIGNDGWIYLECYSGDIDMTGIPWSDSNAPSSVETSTDVGTGLANTNIILDMYGHRSSAALFATFAETEGYARIIKRIDILDSTYNLLGTAYGSYGGFSRIHTTFSTSYLDDTILIRLYSEEDNTGEAWWDSLQLEKGSEVTDYSDGNSILVEYYVNAGMITDLNTTPYMLRFLGGAKITKGDQRDKYDI